MIVTAFSWDHIGGDLWIALSDGSRLVLHRGDAQYDLAVTACGVLDDLLDAAQRVRKNLPARSG